MTLLREPAENTRSMESVSAGQLADESSFAFDLLVCYVTEADRARLIVQLVQIRIVVVNLLHPQIFLIESLGLRVALVVIDWLELAVVVAHDGVEGL